MNAYSIDLRERVMCYLDECHTYAETSSLFKICMRTVYNWSRLRKYKRSLEFKNTPRSPHKLPDKELLEYVKNNPDKFLREIADHFNCGVMTVHDSLKRNCITYKKTKNISRKKRRKT